MTRTPHFPLDPEELKRRLTVMRNGYRTRVPEKVAEIQSLWERVKGASPADEVRDQLLLAVHTMVGSAPTLGCEGLGAAARDLETLLRSVLLRREPVAEDDRAAIDRQVGLLGQSLD